MYPLDFQNVPGYPMPKIRIRCINRTGAALVKGDLAAFNLAFAATAGQAMTGLDPHTQTDDASGYLFNAAIAVTTEAAGRICMPADEDIADNAEGWFVYSGPAEVEMNGANAGEFLAGTNGQTYATPLTLTELASVAAATQIFGLALEASSGAQVKRALWKADGWGNHVGV